MCRAREPQCLPSRSLQSRLLSPRVLQSQSKRVVSSVPVGSWWFFLKHRPNTSPHLTPPRGSLGVSGWKRQTAGYLFLGSLAIACVKYLCFLSRSTASVSEASKGNLSCSGQNPYNFIPWGRLLALFAVVSRAARAFSLNASFGEHITFPVKHTSFASVLLSTQLNAPWKAGAQLTFCKMTRWMLTLDPMVPSDET